MARVGAAVCLLLALASLALPSGPTYDPYAWLIWGRDIAHLHLVTTGGGTSWKPLPALIDALLTPLGANVGTNGWLVVARAGALFALFMAFRLAWRLAPERKWVGGTCAALTLALTQEWVLRNGMGNAEGLMVAFGLLAIDRHLDGRRGQAFALIVAATLIRIEAWPFALAYGAWMWWRREQRLAVLVGSALIPLLWFGGDWVGSGSATTAAGRALLKKPGTPGASRHPFQAVVTEALGMLPPAAWVAVAVAVLLLARGSKPVRWLAAGAAAWTVIIALMAARGYAGLPRFLFMACALEAVVAGLAVAWLAQRARTAWAPVAIALAFAVGSLPSALQLPAAVAGIDQIADRDAQLGGEISNERSAAAVLRCGAPWYTVPVLAYDLDVPTADIPRSTTTGWRPALACRASGDSSRRDSRAARS